MIKNNCWPLHFIQALTLVTHPMMQRQPNPTELRSMDSYNQILCRFQKSKQKVLYTLYTPKEEFYSSFEGVKGDFLEQSSDGGGTFYLLLWNLHKIWI